MVKGAEVNGSLIHLEDVAKGQKKTAEATEVKSSPVSEEVLSFEKQ